MGLKERQQHVSRNDVLIYVPLRDTQEPHREVTVSGSPLGRQSEFVVVIG